MALVGGGGAPNVAGSNPTGTSSTLNYMGGGVWAGWSGSQVLNNNTVTLFEFSTGPAPLKAILEWYLEITGNASDSKNFNCVVTINGEPVIQNGFRTTASRDAYDIDPMHVIFPATVA